MQTDTGNGELYPEGTQESLMRVHDTITLLQDHVGERARGVLAQQADILQAVINSLGQSNQ